MTCWLWKKKLRSFQNHHPRDLCSTTKSAFLSRLFITKETSESRENDKFKIVTKSSRKVLAVFFDSLKIIKGEKVQWERERAKNVADELWTSHENSLKFSLSTTAFYETPYLCASLSLFSSFLSLSPLPIALMHDDDIYSKCKS